MAIGTTSLNQTKVQGTKRSNLISHYSIVLASSYGSLFVGSISSSLLSRFYFVHGGSSRWVSTFVQSAGFPLLIFPIYLSNNNCRRRRPFSDFTLGLFAYSIAMGFFLGANNLFISWGVSYLSVSTSSLLLSSQLAFSLVLSVVLVKQKIRFTNLNCVLLLTLSSVVLAIGSSKDRPNGVTAVQFFLGFLATLAAALMFAVYLPMMEIVYRGVKSYRMVMEMQFVMEAAATVFAVAGMAANGGFKEMAREGRKDFNLGETYYWITISATIVCWQFCFMGTAGMIFLTASLNSGICMSALLSMNVLGGVLVFGDVFGGLKAVSLTLCLWGFASYLYGEYKRKKEEEEKLVDEGEEGQEMERVGLDNEINEDDKEISV